MMASSWKGGFGKAEVICITAALVLIVVVLYPIFSRHGTNCGFGKPSPCIGNLRLLTVAAQMYVQDHDNRFPGVEWVQDLYRHPRIHLGPDPKTGYDSYLTINRDTFSCPSDARSVIKHPVSFGYSGLLLRADGSGVTLSQVIQPDEVGMFCESSPLQPFPRGGIIGGGGLQASTRNVMPAFPHGKPSYTCVDGHVGYEDHQKFNDRDLANNISRSFYQASALRYVDNPAGGMSEFLPRVLGEGPVAIGGESCTAPLLRAAAAAWARKAKVKVTNCGFTGQDAKRPLACVWGTGDGVKPAGNSVAIAQDAVVIIVSRGSKIPALLNEIELAKRRSRKSEPESKHVVPLESYNPSISYESVRKLFNGYNGHIYTFGQHSGTRAFFTRAFATHGRPMTIHPQAVVVNDDWEMVEKVAHDRKGIGYCSAVAVDFSRNIPCGVYACDLILPDGRITRYPQNPPQDDQRRLIVPTNPTWPLMRTLYAVSTLPKDNHFVDEMLAPGSPGNKALQAGALFKASYYKP